MDRLKRRQEQISERQTRNRERHRAAALRKLADAEQRFEKAKKSLETARIEFHLIVGLISVGRAKEKLSRRELETFELIKQNLTNKEIGTRLRISASTVKFHVTNVLLKLGYSSRREVLMTDKY